MQGKEPGAEDMLEGLLLDSDGRFNGDMGEIKRDEG